MIKPILRFAPSPNGRLHLGHAYCAWLNRHFAKALNGTCLLRIEDIDITRCTTELTQACIEDLTWLGMTWETPVRIQSQHFAEYIAALDTLKQRQLVYPCFCSRSDIKASSIGIDPDGAALYPRTCATLSQNERQRRIAAGEPHSWRLDMAAALRTAPPPHHYVRFTLDKTETVSANPTRWGDVILARKEVPTSYHLAVVVDDALQGITHVVRGADLESATDLHVLLQALLGLPQPLYHHHKVLREPTGDKLAKSKNSESLADLRAKGMSAQDVRIHIESAFEF